MAPPGNGMVELGTGGPRRKGSIVKLFAVVAAAENEVIGRDGQLPWRLPADLQRFKALTLGKPVIMGRKTWESIGRPLPGRLNVILTRSGLGGLPEGCVTADSLAAALAHPEVRGAEEVAIIGGEQIFREALPLCERLELTRVHTEVEGDARFAFDSTGWVLERSERRPPDEKNPLPMTFETWRQAQG